MSASLRVNRLRGGSPRPGKWFSPIDKVHRPSTLPAAWRSLARNKGAAGVDRMCVERFAAQEGRYLQALHEHLWDGSYQPHPVKRVEIPEGDGKTRPLGIPSVKDRVVQAALRMVIEPIYQPSSDRAASASVRASLGCKACPRVAPRATPRMPCGKSIG
jgi:RNA-directed DNA polymerase